MQVLWRQSEHSAGIRRVCRRMLTYAARPAGRACGEYGAQHTSAYVCIRQDEHAANTVRMQTYADVCCAPDRTSMRRQQQQREGFLSSIRLRMQTYADVCCAPRRQDEHAAAAAAERGDPLVWQASRRTNSRVRAPSLRPHTPVA
jgi:hypothetical protein